MKHLTKGLLPATALLCLSPTLADAVFFHVGSGSIDGSLCVGNDCVSSEAFGFDTIRLKENNLRLHFDDTSTTASFPLNDWRLYANDSANGGDSYFGVEDATAGRFVFRVFAGARSNALTVDSQGDLGLGTTTPATDIDVKIGDTPTLRLQQDGTSGFTPQTWDVAGNEAGFFVRDATSGSTLPFRIMTGGAPSQSLVIDGDGEVGVGAGTNPDASLHVERSDGTAKLKVEETSGTATARTIAEFINNGRPDMVLANASTSNEWSIGGGTNMVMKAGALGSLPSAKTTHFTLTNAGNLTITGTLTTGGPTCGGGCDRVFTERLIIPQSDYATAMWDQGHLPHVGPTAEGDPINVSEKLGGILNALEHAHIFIDEQRSEIHRLEAEVDRLSSLEARLTRLEATLAAE